jgi:hypothetical protein
LIHPKALGDPNLDLLHDLPIGIDLLHLSRNSRFRTARHNGLRCLQPNNEASAIREKKVRTNAFISLIMQRGGAHRQLLISRIAGQVDFARFYFAQIALFILLRPPPELAISTLPMYY